MTTRDDNIRRLEEENARLDQIIHPPPPRPCRRCLRHGGHHVWIEITQLGDTRRRELCAECGRTRRRRFSSP